MADAQRLAEEVVEEGLALVHAYSRVLNDFLVYPAASPVMTSTGVTLRWSSPASES